MGRQSARLRNRFLQRFGFWDLGACCLWRLKPIQASLQPVSASLSLALLRRILICWTRPAPDTVPRSPGTPESNWCWLPGYSKSRQTSAMSARCPPSSSATTTSIALIDRSDWRLPCRAASSAGRGVAAGPRWSPLGLRASRLTPTRLLPPYRFLGMSLGRRFRPQRTDQGASPLRPRGDETKRSACHRRRQGLTWGRSTAAARSGGHADPGCLDGSPHELAQAGAAHPLHWSRAAALALSRPARAFVSSLGD